ncbi:MAG: hypothetical protein WAV15_04080 [Minisyncoccia bacterium]
MGKIKQFLDSDKGKDILVVMIVILVGMGSFELGRLSKGSSSSGIQIEYLNPEGAEAVNQTGNAIQAIQYADPEPFSTLNSSGKNFFASNRGSKYYSLGCSGGKTIKQENRIYFATAEEAEKAGYTLSTSCN